MFKYQDRRYGWGVAHWYYIEHVMWTAWDNMTRNIRFNAINQFISIYFINFLSIFDSKVSLNLRSSSISRILRKVCMDEDELRVRSCLTSVVLLALCLSKLLLLRCDESPFLTSLLSLTWVVFLTSSSSSSLSFSLVVVLFWKSLSNCCCWSIKVLTPLSVHM